MTSRPVDRVLGKVPAVTVGFWLIKIAATTVGETGGDWVTMSLNLGYAIGTAIFFVVFVCAVYAQVEARRFHPALYWFCIIATTTLGTTVADFCDRSLGAGYLTGMSILLCCVLASLAYWRWQEGSIAVETVTSPRVEAFTG
jgi:uncharacterized membrane-anchored protein